MNSLVTHIYDFLRRHASVGWVAFVAITVVLAASLLSLRYKEDISDFLPMDEANRTALSVYQDVSGANNIYAILSARDTADVVPDALTDGVDFLVETVQNADTLGLISDITARVDMDRMMEVADMIYADIPLFLTDADYARMDSLLAMPGYIARKVAEDKEMLLFPSSQLLVQGIARDPLDLFSPVPRRLSHLGMSMQYETYDGYILSPDGTKAIVILRSASGASESDNNTSLLSLLNEAAARTEAANPDLDVHIIGGPAIAVSNAERIRQDSMLAVTLSGVLILALLIYVFRSARNILLIVVSVGWGWLFAMGGMALLSGSVSVIVIGIASVILGIAVNYPLHLIDHLRDSDHPRAALREIVSPLVIGNITTVGAFLCVVPLEASALHDLGVFSSLLLVGTIIFVLVFLPHAVRTRTGEGGGPATGAVWITRMASISMENHRWMVRAVLLLTVVFAWFSLRTEFDSDMRNINYMTEEQRADFDYFNAIFNRSTDTETAYLVSSGTDWQKALRQNELAEAALDPLVQTGLVRCGGNVSSFLSSHRVQTERLQRWQDFLARHANRLRLDLAETSRAEGFSSTAFTPFLDILSAEYAPRDFEHFRGLTSTVFSGNVSEDASVGRKSIVQTVELRPADMERLRRTVEATDGYEGMVFDVRSMNEAMTRTLSDNFNYIGLACGCIVFFFLWFSFGNAELAIASFVPMAVSWLWILGIMAMLGIRFNIVNIILATFIFGQGDDYTIFMTEGLSYEYAYRRRLLASYKNSIVVSALIMFIGMGTLVFAQHPALRSLGEVIVVGMSSVVLMAYLFPPLIFNWLVRSRDGRARLRPVTIGRLFRTSYSVVLLHAVLSAVYVMGMMMRMHDQARYRRRISYMLSFLLGHIPGVNLVIDNDGTTATGNSSASACILRFRSRSSWDVLVIMACFPDVIIVADGTPSTHIMLRSIMRRGGYVATVADIQGGRTVSSLVATESCDAAIAMAKRLQCDIRPLHIIGSEYILPCGSDMVCAGLLYIGMGSPVHTSCDGPLPDALAGHCHAEEVALRRHVLGFRHLLPVVLDRYRYKGRDVESRANRALHRMAADTGWMPCATSPIQVTPTDDGDQGERALLLALMYPDMEVHVTPSSRDARDIILGCIDGCVDNVTVADCPSCR